MRLPLRLAAAIAVTVVAHLGVASAQPVKNRISILVDSSGSMLQTTQIVTFTETCTGWDPCTFNGNPSAAQETCNACVIDTINFRSSCATTWNNTCRNDYANCVAATAGGACSATLTVTDAPTTRGDGSADLPGCDLNGNGLADDSRMYQAKEALQDVIATFGEVEFSLWRYRQITGGQTCTSDGQCPDTPGGLSVMTCEDVDNNAATPRVCALDADIFDGPTTAGFEGQCYPLSYTGAPNNFSCNACDFQNTYNRANCMLWDLDQIRTGGTSPINGATVTCYPTSNPQHRFMRYHGGFGNNGACDPTGAEQLVGFPATGFDDNYLQIFSWIDHNQNPFATADELRPMGGTPIAASLRDMRTAVFNSARLDTRTPCRKHQVIVLTDGGESCESVNAAVTAAASFQNMSFTNAAGTVVADYDVPVYVIGFAVCPSGQPNCQTRLDLNSIAAAGGTGQAILVSSQLELQLALAQIVASSVVAERCNEADDDCDGAVDEDFPGKGSACSVGVGTCFRSGQIVCTADQQGLACNATPGTPSPEVCNGLDDDCDGLIDDGINCQGCVPVCSNAAHCDICNNLDEDCDGRIDEDFSPTSCGVDTGACQTGTTTCTMGAVACAGSIGPVVEACNNVDDDCDAVVDGMTQPCYPPATPGCDVMTGVCQGVCRTGTATCTAGAYGTCTGAVTPGTEIACNQLDDDCDGNTDEGVGTEQCNGLDDDCDGRIDEGVAVTDEDIGDPCGTPPFVGECRPGTIQCVAGSQQCVGEVDPTTEACDTLDNDCDGRTDEQVPGFGGPCGSDVGRCDPGTLECVGGAPQCVGQVGPFPEVCNNLDDNCNNATDETDPNLGSSCNTLPGGGTVATDVGECAFGVLACQMGGLVCVGAVGPTDERCNGLDDDCDGMVDETFPVGTACDNGQPGVCRQTGVTVCAPSGLGVVCTAPPGVPGVESCNGLDDDCDDATDEGPPAPVGDVCAPSSGVCLPGRWECRMGQLVCGSPSSGSPEICNGVDDDCDALVDESPPGSPLPGEEEPCVAPGFEPYGDTGECDFGHTECVTGAIECVGYVGPQPEICDGLDNDCDGNADDMATCPVATNACVEGQCVVPCGTGEFPCPAGYTCQDRNDVTPPGRYCVPDPCLNVTCGAGEQCNPNTGECQSLCEGIMCRVGEECRAGFCLDCFDLPERCAAGELCVADNMGVGQCQDNPCEPNPCAPGQVCTDGTCSSGCGAGCPDGQLCVGGACEVDRCEDVRCPPGQVCNPTDGRCIAPDCEGVQCAPSEVCVATTGDCITNPCLTTECPAGTVCTVDPIGRPVCDEPHDDDTDRVTAAGGGCQAGGGAPTWLLAAAALPLLRRRRRRRRAGRGVGGAA